MRTLLSALSLAVAITVAAPAAKAQENGTSQFLQEVERLNQDMTKAQAEYRQSGNYVRYSLAISEAFDWFQERTKRMRAFEGPHFTH